MDAVAATLSSVINSGGLWLEGVHNGSACGDQGFFHNDDFRSGVCFRFGVRKVMPNADAVPHSG